MHDLRNPTQALSLMTDLLDEAPGKPLEELRVTIEEIAGDTARSIDLLDRVLGLSAPGAEPGPVSLRPILEFVQTLNAVHKSGIDLMLEEDLHRLPAVVGVERDIEHVVLNLVLNATEALGRSIRGTIRIEARRTAGQVELAVEDDGPGVADEMQGRLFQPYATTKKGQPMAGLGLAAARSLARGCGGDLRHQPRGPRGARFTVSLPVWSQAAGSHPPGRSAVS